MRSTRRGYLRTVAIAGTVAGCSGGGGGGGRRTVDMTDSLTFEPETLSVAVGDTVTWRTVGSAAHSVTAYGDRLPDGAAYFASGGFESADAARSAYPEGAVPRQGTYAHTFETPGTHHYFCVPHERAGMVGRIEVAEA